MNLEFPVMMNFTSRAFLLFKFITKVFAQDLLPLFNALTFRRSLRAELRPYNDVEPNPSVPNGWIATGSDPSFIFHGILPSGWLKVDLAQPRERVDYVRVYLDYGNGFNEHDCLRLGFGKNNFCRIEPHIQNLRIDPLEGIKGQFTLQPVYFRRVSRFEVLVTLFYRMVVREFSNRGFVLGAKSVARTIVRGLRGRGAIPALKDGLESVRRGILHNEEDKYHIWIRRNESQRKTSAEIADEIQTFRYLPKFSIVIPTYNSLEKWLVACIESVLCQTYPHFELCFADDASPDANVREVLSRYAAKDPRIKVVLREKNGHISEATNSAMELATGDFICLMDHDDEIDQDALFEFARVLNKQPDVDMIYSDEDKIDINGRRYEPFFKPDWSPEYLENCMYTAHFACYRSSIARAIGGFRKECNGAQDYDFVLRFVEKAGKIRHVPKVLYHWRAIPGSTAQSMDQKNYVLDAAIRALTDRLRREGNEGTVQVGPYAGSFMTRRKLVSQPLVSIVIPSAGRSAVVNGRKIDLLAHCVESIVSKTTYKKFEIIVVDNNDLQSSTFERVRRHVREFVHFTDPVFNIAVKMNLGVKAAKGEFVLLLNDDIEIITPDWLEALLEVGLKKGVGVVGPQLLFEDGTLQHAGVSFNNSGMPDHVFRGYPGNYPGHFFNVCGPRNYMAVTGACLLTSKALYESVGGFDPDFGINYNDVDFCLKVYQKGYRIAYTPYSKLYHFESKCRERSVAQNELDLFRERWLEITRSDSYYNMNLDGDPPNFNLKVFA